MASPDDLKLCLVKGQWAYFTTQTLSDQWGDDWNDRPYEHNAGEPYRYQREGNRNAPRERPWTILKVAFDGTLDAPCDLNVNSPYSVEEINAGAVPWLRSPPWANLQVKIPAGTSLARFRELVQQAHGMVYEPIPSPAMHVPERSIARCVT